ncbi:MAG: patatin-like phospholipase family protein, partial [Pseudomonadota bacterium]
MGAIIGAACASGCQDAVLKKICEIEFQDVPALLSPSWPSKGFFSGRKFVNLIHEIIPYDRIEDFPHPFAAIAVDLVEPRRVVLCSGPIDIALRASSSIPVLFNPVERNNEILVDGALIDPVPVSACRELGADDVISVDLFADRSRATKYKLDAGGRTTHELAKISSAAQNIKERKKPGEAYSIADIAIESLAVAQRELARLQSEISKPVFTFAPPVSDIDVLDFHRGEETIDRSYQWAREKVPQ